MSGRVLRVVPRIGTDFRKLNTGSETVLLARFIDISQYREATLYIRFHSGTNMNNPTSARVVVYADGFTAEDPAAAAASPATNPAFLGSLASVSFGTVVANTMLVLAVPANPGGLITLAMEINQAGAPVSAAVVLSIDLSLKE